jgi:hypothetical protein
MIQTSLMLTSKISSHSWLLLFRIVVNSLTASTLQGVVNHSVPTNLLLRTMLVLVPHPLLRLRNHVLPQTSLESKVLVLVQNLSRQNDLRVR